MRMKKKLRKAFDSAAPDVLGRVLRECSASEDSAPDAAAPPSGKSKKLPYWLKETLSTAAAFALLIGVISGSIWLGLSGFDFQGSQGTDPTETSTVPPEPSTIPPTGYDIETEITLDSCIDEAKTLLCADWAETEASIEVKAAYITDIDGQVVYHIELHYLGYWYYFDYDAYTGQLSDIGVVICDCLKEGYISQEVAVQILRVAGYGGEADAHVTLYKSANSETVYQIGFGNYDPALISTFHYVNAISGEILANFAILDDSELGKLEEFNTLFGDLNSLYNRALTCTYASPEEIAIGKLFGGGFADEAEVTQAEWAELENRGFIPEMDTYRLPADQMNEVLTNYFAITLDDLHEVRFLGLAYLESTGCWYYQADDSNAAEGFQATGMKDNGDGTVTVFYTTFASGHTYAVTLLPKGDKYQILSNVSKDYYDGKVNEDYAKQVALDTLGLSEADADSVECVLADASQLDSQYILYNAPYVVTVLVDGYKYTANVYAYKPEVFSYSRTYDQKVEITGYTEDGIPIVTDIDLNSSRNGFFWDKDGNTACSIHGGSFKLPHIYSETVMLTHEGVTYEVDFKWCTDEGEIGVYCSGDASMFPVSGSGHYIYIYIKDYIYLLDTDTMEISDPLSFVDSQLITDSIRCRFAPDAASALLETSDETYFIDITAGNIRSVAEYTGISGANEVNYISSTLLAVNVIEKDMPQNWYADCIVYDLATGSTRTLYTDQYFGWLIDAGGMEPFNRLHVYHGDGALCFVDCVTGKQYQSDISSYQDVDLCGMDKIFVRTYGGLLYLVESDGTATPVFYFDWGNDLQ